jgi:Ca2+-binding RTX toxin-like protein
MASIQGVYLALFGRPADPLGLAFFNQATGNGANLTAIGDLASTAEYQTRFSGQSSTQIITTIYRSLFNRDPDLAGLTFFANALATGTLSINNIAIAIFDGAQGSDVTIRDLKVAAANAFTAQIDTVAEINGYAGTAAAQSGAAFIASVTTTAPTEAQVTAAVATATSQTPVGQTLTLTDKIDVLNGAGSNDVFLGDAASVSAADQLNGGGGIDTFNFVGAGAAPVIPTLNSIEVVTFTAPTAAITADLSAVAGLTQVGVRNSATAITNITSASGVKASVENVTGGVAATFTTAAAATATTLMTNGSTLGAVALNGAAVTTINIETAAKASTFGSLASTGTEATLNVTGNAALTITAALDTTVKTIDGSANTGGTNVAVNTTGVKFTGGTGADSISFTAGNLSATSTLVGGEGRDTLKVADTNITGTVDAVKGINASTGFEVLALTAGGTTIDVSKVTAASIDTISLQAGGGTYTVNNAVSTKAIEVNAVTIGANDLTINNTLGDLTSNIKLVGTSAAIASAVQTKVSGASTINIDSSFSGSGTSFGANAITFTANSDNSVFKITGAQDITFGGAVAAATGSTIDASAFTGKANISGTASADIIKGGSGNDILNGLAGNDTLTGGAGNDQFRFSAAANGNDKITDFTAANDKIGFSFVDFAGTVATAAGATLAATDYEQARATVTAIALGDTLKVVELQAAQTTTEITTGTGGAANAIVVVFNSTTAKAEIWYDADWSGAAGRVQLASLDNVVDLAGVQALTNNQFVEFA